MGSRRADCTLAGMRRRPPTDYELLREIYERYGAHFAEYVKDAAVGRETKILVPIDIPAIADRFGVDADSIFGRLYYHLDPKYGVPTVKGQPRKVFFTPVAGDDRTCVNFPLLEAVLAGLWQEWRRDLLALATAFLSLGIALASLFVSIFAH
jgi:hypothetical protein